MKRLCFFTVILFLSSTLLNAGQENDSTIKTVGLSMYHVHSASGYGRSATLNMSIEKERRYLASGIIMQLESAGISGGEVLYRRYFSSVCRNMNSIKQNKTLRLYFQYNFIFRRHILPDHIGTITSTLQEAVIPGGGVATFEHYAGIGTQVRIFDRFYLDAGLGYGIILGSVDDKFLNEPHYTLGGNKNDLGMVTRFGLGYFFNR